MDSSRTSEQPPGTGTVSPANVLRFRGHRGGVISMHRALAHFSLRPMNLAVALSLCVIFVSVWLMLLPLTCTLWSRIFAAGIQVLPLHAELARAQHHWFYLRFTTPYLRIEPLLPSLETWSLTCAATLLLFAATFFLSNRWIPVIYLARGVLLVQATALLYFALLPARFPHTPESYLSGLVTSGMALISIVPLLFALTYYIFDFGLLKKALLTAMTMVHLALFLPVQVLLQALVLQQTVLFMPVLYIIFGMPLDILLIIAFYSWGMSWSFRSVKLRIEEPR